MSNLRDLLGYLLDFFDVLVVRHHSRRFCTLIVAVMSDDDTLVQRSLQPIWERFFLKEQP